MQPAPQTTAGVTLAQKRSLACIRRSAAMTMLPQQQSLATPSESGSPFSNVSLGSSSPTHVVLPAPVVRPEAMRAPMRVKIREESSPPAQVPRAVSPQDDVYEMLKSRLPTLVKNRSQAAPPSPLRIEPQKFSPYTFVRVRTAPLGKGAQRQWFFGYVVDPVDTVWTPSQPLCIAFAVYGVYGGLPLLDGGRPAGKDDDCSFECVLSPEAFTELELVEPRAEHLPVDEGSSITTAPPEPQTLDLIRNLGPKKWDSPRDRRRKEAKAAARRRPPWARGADVPVIAAQPRSIGVCGMSFTYFVRQHEPKCLSEPPRDDDEVELASRVPRSSPRLQAQRSARSGLQSSRVVGPELV